MRPIKLKNAKATTDTWDVFFLQSGQYTELLTQADIDRLVRNVKVNQDIWTGDLVINDAADDLSPADGDAYLKGNNPIEVTPTANKNEYTLKPYGIVHKHLDASQQIHDLTLSNKDGNNIDYSGSTTPEYYDCIFQNHSEIKDGVYSIDGSTITTFNGDLNEGSAKLSKPVDIDYKLQIQESDNIVYLWGLFIDVEGYGDDDVGRLQVCDPDGVGVTLGLYTQQWLEDNHYVIKEYDECWIKTVNKMTYMPSPNNTPAQIVTGYVLRVKYYPKDETKTDIKIWLDYKITLKDT